MKFQQQKIAKFFPAFVYPADVDGIERAQKITANGLSTDSKAPFWEFHFGDEIPNDKKKGREVLFLKKFNTRFGSTFV